MTPLTRRAILIAIVALLTVVGAFFLESLLTLRPERPFGHTRMGRATGWLALAAVLLVFGYSVRKRCGSHPRWSKGWFRIHMGAGVMSTVLALIHSGAHVHALAPILTLASLIVVSLSGVVGQALHSFAVRAVYERRHVLGHQGLVEGEIEARLHTLAAQEEGIRMWQYFHAPIAVTFIVLLLLHIGGALYFGGL